MGTIYRTSLLVFFLFFSTLLIGQDLDTKTTFTPTLSGKYSVYKVLNVTDSSYIVQGSFVDYRPTTYIFTADSVSIGDYYWSSNCEKWLIDSVNVNGANKVLTLRVKGKVGKPAPVTGVGAIIDYRFDYPVVPYGLAASLTTCIGDDFNETLNNRIFYLVTAVPGIDSTTISNDSMFVWAKGNSYFTGFGGSISSSGGTGLSVLDTTFTTNYTASTDSVINILTSVTESNDIVVTFPTPSASTVGVSYTTNQIDRNGDGMGLTLVQVDGVDYDFYHSGDTVQFVSFTPDLDESYQFQTIYLNGSYRWLATLISSQKSFELASISQILTRSFNTGDQITIKASSGRESFKYRVQASAITGYTTDTINVVPTANSKFAVVVPEQGKINVGWFTSGEDATDDTKYFRAVGSFLRYSSASTLFVPKGDWYINENLSSYNPNIGIYGNFEGVGMDSTVIRADSITALSTGNAYLFRMLTKHTTMSGLAFDIIGNNASISINQLTLVGLDANNQILERCHFRKFTLGTTNTAGNTYVVSGQPQTNIAYTTTSLDTIYPGTNVGIKLAESEGFTYLQAVVIDDGSGHSDTTYVTFNHNSVDSIIVARITDTIYAGAIVKVPGYGITETRLLDNTFENCWDCTAVRLIAQNVWVERNKFINNGQISNQHDMYNQCGMQVIRDNWFEGGSGYAFNDANKQNYRISGARIITGNTLFNKQYGIALATTNNPVAWYTPGVLPVSYYGNRILAEGDRITDNLFFNTPGKPATTAFIIQASFGGIDPSSPLVGNASLTYSNNTHIGRINVSADSDYLDLLFTDNLFELNDTSALGTVTGAILSPNAKVYDNEFISRGPDHLYIGGNSLRVDNLTFKQKSVTTLNEVNVAITDSWVTGSRFEIDTIYGLAQSTPSSMISPTGGAWQGNKFINNSSWVSPMVLFDGSYASSKVMPDFIDNQFVNTGVALKNSFHRKSFKNTVIKDNPGMRMWQVAQVGYPFASAEQTSQSGQLRMDRTKNLTGTAPAAGELIVIDSDSTRSAATYTSENITGVLVLDTRSDSMIMYAQLGQGAVLRINSTNAVNIGDYMKIDPAVSGKLISVGRTLPTDVNLLAVAMEKITVWDSGTTYAVGDQIEYNNRNYKCTKANTNQAPQADQYTADRYWAGQPIKVQILYSGFVNQARISGLTNPLGGTNQLQPILDSIAHVAEYFNSYVDITSPISITFTAGSIDPDSILATNRTAVGFTYLNGVYSYTGTGGVFEFDLDMSFEYGEASTSIFGDLYLNGSRVAGCGFEQHIPAVSEVNVASGGCIITLANGDDVEVKAASNTHTGDDNLDIYKFKFIGNKIK